MSNKYIYYTIVLILFSEQISFNIALAIILHEGLVEYGEIFILFIKIAEGKNILISL